MRTTVLAVLAFTSACAAAPPVKFERLPIVTAEQRAAGLMGGEGSQWPRAVAVSPADPSVMMFLTDVGGVYRSLDGGRTWGASMRGYHARGGNAVALDPRDADRVLVVAGYSQDHDAKTLGVYLSTDRGASWTQTLPSTHANGGAVAFDPARAGRAYYASPTEGLFRSDDGGATWRVVNDALCRRNAQGVDFPQQEVAVAPGGVVLLAFSAGPDAGVHRSTDGGATFARASAVPTRGLDVARDVVFVCDDEGVKKSDDGGATFAKLAAGGLELTAPLHDVSASPADPRRMTVWRQGEHWRWDRFVSHDGGATFELSSTDPAGAILPQNARQGIVDWHPTDPDVALGVGGDWPTVSRDGGRTFRWSGDGENAVMVGGLFNFSPSRPDVVALFFQDYNGATTRDGGRTWQYHDVSGKGWGGYCYGGFSPDGTLLFGGDAPGWGGPRKLRISADGGKTWRTDEGVTFAGLDVSYASPDGRALFASNWRSTDNGATWATMPDCTGVLGSVGGELFGRSGDAKHVVVSRDAGATWARATPDLPAELRDAARAGPRWYASADRALWACDAGAWRKVELPKDALGNAYVHTVAADPVDPRVVYAGGAAHQYATKHALFRSTDAGATWHVLTDVAAGELAPHEIECVRVHPRTRDLWISGQCFGMWRLAAPPDVR